MTRMKAIDGAAGLTAERLRHLLDYNPATGEFTHRTSHDGIKSGSIAGTVDSRGYHRIGVDGSYYQASRLAYLWMTGEWPPEQMDHINRDRADDRWENLRAVSCSENARNRKLPRRNDLPTGVHSSPNSHKLQAQISVNGKKLHLGMFSTPEAAAAAYERALRSIMPSGPAIASEGVTG